MNTVISVRVDKQVKESAQEVARSAGLTLGALVNSYLRQIVATRRIEIYAPEPMTPKLEKMIAKVEAEIASNKISKGYDDPDDFLAALDK